MTHCVQPARLFDDPVERLASRAMLLIVESHADERRGSCHGAREPWAGSGICTSFVPQRQARLANQTHVGRTGASTGQAPTAGLRSARCLILTLTVSLLQPLACARPRALAVSPWRAHMSLEAVTRTRNTSRFSNLARKLKDKLDGRRSMSPSRSRMSLRSSVNVVSRPLSAVQKSVIFFACCALCALGWTALAQDGCFASVRTMALFRMAVPIKPACLRGLLLHSQSTLLASALGSTCSSPLGAGTAGPNDPFWLETIKHQGTAPLNSDASTYQVFRNVKDFGAKGDGVTDDTAAINAAISAGARCGLGCQSSTTSPAVVYFPSGTYLVSTPIIALYYTQLIGDARKPPTLLASANFNGMAVIDADPYIPGGGGAQYYVNQNNFFRSVRNFVIDLTRMPASASATGLHWQVSQATSLMNIVVEMSTAAGNNHQGMFMENGSGGFMGDLVFNGGKYGIWVGNQQFTVRNITVNNANTAVFSIWNWGWTFQGVTINNCQVGFDLSTGGTTQASQTVGAIAVIDATVINTPIFVRNSQPSNSLAGSLVLNNINLQNVPTAVGVVGGQTVLAGGTTTIQSWGQGNIYSGTSSSAKFVKSNIPAPTKAGSLLDGSGRIFGRTHPQYANYAVSQFVSVKSQGAKGDGKTDDTAALQNVFNQFAGCKIIFFDAGVYYITSTLKIPAGTQMVGEGWSVIMGGGSAFSNMNSPTVMVQAGAPGSSGILEITDIVFTTKGPAPGAIVMEWNVNSPTQGGAGMWDTHFRLGGAAGTNLQSNCPSGSDTTQCTAAFMTLHLTSGSNAYLEGTWVWVADHDLDGSGEQLTIFAGRGLLSESQGPVWLVGTAVEHHTLYQYNLHNAANHYMGLIQTETPYYQPSPAQPAPFSVNTAIGDPNLGNQPSAWALVVQNSKNILVFGAGLYSFFQNYGQACLDSSSCQDQILNIDSGSTISVYSLSTVGVTHQLSVGGQAVIPQSQNANGFQSTVTAWTR